MDILIIEDDPEIVQFVRAGLEEAGFSVDAAATGTDGLRKAQENTYRLIILDLMFSDVDGFTILRDIRAKGNETPVIVASARQAVHDKVFCLNAGSDDYITKPFSLAELLARINAIIRRDAKQVPGAKRLAIGGVELDIMERKAFREGQEIPLKAKEFSLLKYLMENAGSVVSRAMIMKNVWGYDFDPGTKIIDVYICQLREKIDIGRSDRLIQTVRGTGYVFLKP